MLVDLPSTNDLIDVSSGDSNTPSQQQIFNNNNSLLVTTTGDSHENKGKFVLLLLNREYILTGLSQQLPTYCVESVVYLERIQAISGSFLRSFHVKSCLIKRCDGT